MTLYAFSLALLLVQSPGDSLDPLLTPPREIKQLYWDLTKETKVWIRIVPECPGNKSPLLDLVFEAYFPGGVNPYSGRPKEPKGPPARITLQAQPWPLTAIRELSLRIAVDGKTFDLTAPGSRYRTVVPVTCIGANDNCIANAVETELEPAMLRSLVSAQTVGGQALGFPIKLTKTDQAALAEFVKRIGLLEAEQPTK